MTNLKMFWKHLSCTSNQHRVSINRGICWEVAILEHMKTRLTFMNKVNEIASECGFTTKDEVVKLLFLIHNQDSRV